MKFILLFLISLTVSAGELLPKEKRLALFDQFVSEIERIDGEGLLARKNRPEPWKVTIGKLRLQLEAAKSKIDMGQVFRKLDATYPNLHARVTLHPDFDLTAGKIRAVIGARFAVDEISPRQKTYKVKIRSVESAMFNEIETDQRPQVGDELVSINNRLMADWMKENFIFCKFPFESQCAANVFDNFRKGLLSWDWRDPLEFVLRRGLRVWALSIPFIIPSPEHVQATPAKVSDQCHGELNRYEGFSLSLAGHNICVFESTKYPGVVVLRIVSFAYREIPKANKIQTIDDEVNAFAEAFWKEKAPKTKKLIVDVIDNGGGDTPVAWYEVFLSRAFQEQYTQFKKITELEDPVIRSELFYTDKEKEIWFQELQKIGKYQKIRAGEFLPPVPQFCAEIDKSCSLGEFRPKPLGFKGTVRIMVNEWCISSCTGFVWNLKDKLKERVKIIGIPDSGDSAYARLFLDVKLEKESKDGFSITTAQRAGRTKQQLPEGFILRQQVTATRSTDAKGKIISAVPTKVDIWVPYRFHDFDAPWEARVFEAALKN